MALPLDISQLPRDVQRPFEQISTADPARRQVPNNFTATNTFTRDLENIKLVPATEDGRMQIQWADLTAHGGRTNPPDDVVSMDVHGDPHWHWELYTFSATAQTLVKRIAVDYDVDNPFITMHGGGLFLEGQSTAELAAGGDPVLRFGGTKATSQEMEIRANDGAMEWNDREGGDIVRMTLAMSTGHLFLETGGLKIGRSTGTNQQFIEMWEQASSPAAPAANSARIFTRDNGAGKTQIAARFPTGAVQVIATEP